MTTKFSFARKFTYGLVAAGALALAFEPAVVAAQPQDYYDSYSQDVAPPEGQYADAPEGYEDNYDPGADEQYATAASSWADQNCVQERANNTVGGAIVGGVVGALAGSAIAGRGDRTEGAVIGGALGATAGAAIGNSQSSMGCPPGYVTRPGATAFYYAGGPAYGSYYYGPSWYRPWSFVGGRWVYRPYRVWYHGHRRHWRPGRRVVKVRPARPIKRRHRY